MVTPAEGNAAPAEVTFQVTVFRRPAGAGQGWQQVTSAESDSDAAIAFIESERDAAAADGLAERDWLAAPDPTGAAALSTTAGTGGISAPPETGQLPGADQ